MREFGSFHPVVTLLYFSAVLYLAMTVMHPLCQLLSLMAALLYVFLLRRKKSGEYLVKYILPVAVFTVLLNPAFNHAGETILAYFPSGNPLTLESMLYGISAGLMLSVVMLLFVLLSVLMTGDKIQYLFGRLSPSLALIFSMILRFIPRFTAHLSNVKDAKRCLYGKDEKRKMRFAERVKDGIQILWSMIGWSMENAVETADSMKARGHGIPGRQVFRLYKTDTRDRCAIACIILLFGYILFGVIQKSITFVYFPSISFIRLTAYDVSVIVCYALLFFLPGIIEGREALKWKKKKAEA